MRKGNGGGRVEEDQVETPDRGTCLCELREAAQGPADEPQTGEGGGHYSQQGLQG